MMSKNLIAALTAGLAVPAIGQSSTPAQPLTRAAAMGVVQTLFAEADANRDGLVTLAEANQGHAQYRRLRAERRHSHALRHDAGAQFAAMDSNGNGNVTRTEYDAFRGMMSAMRAKPSHLASGSRPPRMGLRIDGLRFRRGDTNKDGSLTLLEAVNLSYYYFDRMDANRDGQLTVSERAAYRAARAKAAPKGTIKAG